MNDRLRTALKSLRLSGLSQSLEVRLHEAQSHNLNHVEFLELILQDELVVRSDRLFSRRVKAACFREVKTLDQFDWSFNPAVKKKQVFDLAAGGFIREARDVLWLGPPGLGKSHLVQAIGYQAIKAGFLVLYRSIFDVVRDFLHDDALGQDDKTLARLPTHSAEGRPGRAVRLRCVTTPDAAQRTLLNRLGVKLPSRLRRLEEPAQPTQM